MYLDHHGALERDVAIWRRHLGMLACACCRGGMALLELHKGFPISPSLENTAQSRYTHAPEVQEVAMI